MPVYEFYCSGCGRTIERLLSKPQKTYKSYCGKAGKTMTLKRVFSPTRGIVKNPAVPRKAK